MITASVDLVDVAHGHSEHGDRGPLVQAVDEGEIGVHGPGVAAAAEDVPRAGDDGPDHQQGSEDLAATMRAFADFADLAEAHLHPLTTPRTQSSPSGMTADGETTSAQLPLPVASVMVRTDAGSWVRISSI